MATTEVSDILAICDCLQEANVYGVQVPGDGHFLCVANWTYKRTLTIGTDLVKLISLCLVWYFRERGTNRDGSCDCEEWCTV